MSLLALIGLNKVLYYTAYVGATGIVLHCTTALLIYTNKDAKTVWSGIECHRHRPVFLYTTDWRLKNRSTLLTSYTVNNAWTTVEVSDRSGHPWFSGWDNYSRLYTMVYVTHDRVTMHDIFRLSDLKKETVAAEQTFTSSLRTTSDSQQFFDQINIFTYYVSQFVNTSCAASDDIPVKQTTCRRVVMYVYLRATNIEGHHFRSDKTCR